MSVTGSLQKKRNTWFAVLSLPDKTGKKKPKWIKLQLPPNAKKSEAKAEFQKVLESYRCGSVIYSHNISFSEWVNMWLEHKAATVQQTTIESYRTYAEKRIIPYFTASKAALQKLTGADIQLFYDHLTVEGLSPNTVRRYHAVIHGSLKWAYKLGYIRENPSDRAELPPPSSQPVGQALTLEETNDLLSKIQSERIYPAVFLCVYYGLRREEVLGLEWANVDMENRTIFICKTVTRNLTLVVKETTKNKSSRRLLHMTDEVYKILHQLQIQQALEKLAYGEDYEINDFVMKRKDGSLIRPDYLSSRFPALLKKYGFRHIRLHDLRHTAATLMLENGAAPIDVKNTLGHSTLAITTDLYGQHANREASKRTSATMEAVLKVPS